MLFIFMIVGSNQRTCDEYYQKVQGNASVFCASPDLDLDSVQNLFITLKHLYAFE